MKKQATNEKLPCNCEMPVIPVDRAVDKKRISRKNGGPRRRKTMFYLLFLFFTNTHNGNEN
jgi:hypothetical protein